MSDYAQIHVIICTCIALAVLIIALFSCSNGGESNFESLVKAWKEKKISDNQIELARVNLEMKKLEVYGK